MSDGIDASDRLVPTPLSSLAGDGYQSGQDTRRKIPRQQYRPTETSVGNEQQDSTSRRSAESTGWREAMTGVAPTSPRSQRIDHASSVPC